MEAKEVENQDALTNLLIKSKGFVDELVTHDYKLNYSKVYDNPKAYQISYVDSLANLQQINEMFHKRIYEKNQHYNFFLDDSEDPATDVPIDPELFATYAKNLEQRVMFAYTIKNTWTKGKDFFFVRKGTVMRVSQLYDDHIFADVMYKDKVGLMKLEELQIILSDS